jgi:polyhydroxybutyrate depolymerase
VTRLAALLAIGLATVVSARGAASTLVSGGERRTYVLHVPRRLPATPRPLVVVLHGAGGSHETAIAGTGWEREADAEGFLAVFPDALPAKPDRPVAFLANPRYWNSGKGRGKAWHNTVDDVGFVSRLIDTVVREAPVDRRRVYVTGFSSGGAMAFRLGIELSRRIAAIGPVCGQFWNLGKHPASPVPAAVIVGEADPINPWNGARTKSVWGVSEIKPAGRGIAGRYARAIGIRSAARLVSDRGGVRVSRFADFRDGPEVLEYAVAGQGHVWPGGSTTVSEKIVGRDSGRLDATKVLWEFFRSKSLPGR